MSSSVPIITLNNDVKIPQLGLGVWQLKNGQETEIAVDAAIKAGYRMIDTAALYANEPSVGKAIRGASVPREELFVTTKLWNSDQGYKNAMIGFDKSLKRLGLDYIDMYLIHWPMPKLDQYIATWRAMEEIYSSGRVKAIGVCNFPIAHLENLMNNTTIIPAVNQVELHPRLQQPELRQFCSDRGIYCQSWSPIGGTGGDLLNDSTLSKLAHKHQKSPAQIVLRWHIQIGQIVIPKSTHPERIVENINIFDFELDDTDMAAITAMNTNTRRGPDPETMNREFSTDLIQLASKIGIPPFR